LHNNEVQVQLKKKKIQHLYVQLIYDDNQDVHHDFLFFENRKKNKKKKKIIFTKI